MVRPLALLTILALSATAEDKWVRIRSGPFEVLSNAGDRAARERMYDAEQFRNALSQLLGKKDLSAVWPIRMVVLKDKKQAASYAPPSALMLGRDAWLSTAIDESWFRACAGILIEDNTNRLPKEIDRGLAALVSTIEINGTKLTIGAPPAERSRDWARVRLLATAPEYFGRMRVFISNLEQSAPYDVAYRNAFQKDQATIEKQVDASLAGGKFDAVPIPGRALSEKDFTVREAPAHEGAVALADLLALNPARAREAEAAYKAAGGAEGDEGLKQWEAATKGGSKNPRAWIGLGTREGYLKAAELNPRWSEPQLQLAALETDPGRKATYLQKATVIEPRNAATWRAFALALVDARQFAMAAKAWTGAEIASETPEERARMHQARLDIESQKADAAEEETRRRREAEARDLERVKNAALAEVRAAEHKANLAMRAERGDKPVQTVKMEDLDKTTKFTGKLEKVDCLANGQARLTVRGDDQKVMQFMIQDPGTVAISGGGERALGCGPQQPARPIVLEYTSTRQVQTIEFK